MKIDILLKKFLEEKKEITQSCKVCSESIDFWEKRSEELFAKMDNSEKLEDKISQLLTEHAQKQKK